MIRLRRTVSSKRFLKQLLAQSVAPAVLMAALTATPAAYAQQTTSSIAGQVLTAEGAPAAGTKVVILHVPSGTTSTTTVEANGRFNAISLRVGGPYAVRFEPQGGQAQTVTDVFLQLGETFALNLTLKPVIAPTADAQEIVVSGQREELKLGAQTAFDRDRIEDTPTVSRDLKDIIKQDPRVLLDPTNGYAIQIAGTSPRFNSLTIDGVQANDDFGLNANGYPTHHSPIPLDAIDQLAVVIAPFDVDYDGFQGGDVNIVTKSGTNEVHGTMYSYYSSDKLSGQDIGNLQRAIPAFQTKTRGGSIGFPIIPDKLFMFGSFEDYSTAAPSTYGTTDGAGGSNKVPGIASSDVAAVAAIAQSKYGYNVGNIVASTPEHDRTAVAKLDWNIAEHHRASFTFERSETNQILDGGSSNNTGVPYLSAANSITGTSKLSLSSSYYTYGQQMNNYVLQEFSDWTSDFSTQIELGRKTVSSDRTPLNGYGIGNINVITAGGSDIEFGPDISSQSNVLTTKTDTYKGKFKYTLQDHTVSGGYERLDNDYYDLFIQRSLGQWFFSSLANFQAGTGARFQYANSYTLNPADNAALWSYANNSYYLQDRWTITPSLTVQAGLRFEDYTSGQSPILSSTFEGRYGFANNATLDGRKLYLPRVGFNWQATEEDEIHGGFGQFSTLGPAVWMSNDYNNDGFTQRTATVTSGSLLTNSNLYVPPAANQLLTLTNSYVDALDPKFKIPSSYRFDLAADHDFGGGYKLGIDLLYTKVADGILYQDLRLVQLPGAVAPDGRPIYSIRAGDTRAVTGGQDLLLTNTNQGYSKNASVQASKTFHDADVGSIRINSGYSYTDAKDVNPGTSSVASSTFGNFTTSDPNHPGLATSNYQSSHIFTTSVTWSKAFWDDALTSVTLLGSARSGLPYSFTFGCGSSNGPFGDSACIQGNNRELFYVPTGANDPKINWAASTVTPAQMDAYINQYGLSKYRGQIAPRNAFTAPWFETLDLHFLQELPSPIEGHKLALTLDTQNFSNLLFPSWGRLEQVGFPGAVAVVTPTIDPKNPGQYIYKPTSAAGLLGPVQSVTTRASIWQVQMGIHYSF